MKVLDRFGPRDYAGWEVVVMRVLFAAVVALSIVAFDGSRYPGQPEPNGIAHLVDLTFLSDPGTYRVLYVAAMACLGLYAVGFLLVVALPYLAAFSVATWTLANSQGGIGHSYQMVSLILVLQAATVVYGAVRGRRRGGSGFPWLADRWTRSRLVYFAQVAIVASYVTSAVSKLDNSDGAWLWRSPYFAADIVKAERQSYYSRLEGEFDTSSASRAQWLAEHPMAARAVFAPGLLVELFAFLALLSRHWALAIGLLLVSLHSVIEFMMSLHFPLFQYSVAIWLINVPYWLAAAGRGVVARRPAAGPAAES